MSPALFLLTAVAGGLGAACRLLLDGVIRSRSTVHLPLSTITINLTGSFALGALAGLASERLLPEAWHMLLGTGFLGGYTTFSAAAVETVRLLEERRIGVGLLNGLGVLVAAAAAAGLGLWVGTLR